MAATVVGTPSTGAVDNGGSSTITYTVPVPTSLASGELWVICTWADSNGGYNLTATGFTGAHSTITVTAGFPCMRVLYKVAGSSESNVTVTITGPTQSWICNYVSFRVTGFLTSPDPIDVVATDTSAGTNTDSRAIPAATVAANGSLAIVVACRADLSDATDNTLPGTMTEMYEHETWCSGIVGYQAVNAGSFSPGSATVPYGTAGADGDWLIANVIIAPSGAVTASLLLPRYPMAHMLMR